MMERQDSESQKTESLDQMRRRIDEMFLGERTVKASQSFFKSFLRMAGQTYDSLIYDHVKKVRYTSPAWRSLTSVRGTSRW